MLDQQLDTLIGNKNWTLTRERGHNKDNVH